MNFLQIAYIINLFPEPGDIVSGVFVHNRLINIQKIEHVCFNVFCVPCYNPTPFLKSMLQHTGRKQEVLPDSWNLEGIVYQYVHLRRNTATFFMQKIYPEFNSALEASYAEMLQSQLWTWRPNIIHAHGMYEVASGNIARLVAKKLGIPYVVTVHGSDINYSMKRRPKTYIRTLEDAGKCIFVSRALLNKAKAYGYTGKNSTVIGNGYNPEVFHPMDKREIRQILKIYKTDQKYVGFVGSLIEDKRADKLGTIFTEISKLVKDVTFIVVGDGPLRERIMKETAPLNVIFTGKVPPEQVSQWMNAMDIMVLPSRHEGLPTVAVEAQACGTIVVGSNNGGIPEAVGFEECIVEDGYDFEKRFAVKVAELLLTDHGRLRDEILSRSKKLTWGNIVSSEFQVYEEILSEYRNQR